MKITEIITRTTIIESNGVTVRYETRSSVKGAAIAVRATTRGRRRAARLEALFSQPGARPTGSRGFDLDFYYWWTGIDAPSLDSVKELLV